MLFVIVSIAALVHVVFVYAVVIDDGISDVAAAILQLILTELNYRCWYNTVYKCYFVDVIVAGVYVAVIIVILKAFYRELNGRIYYFLFSLSSLP